MTARIKFRKTAKQVEQEVEEKIIKLKEKSRWPNSYSHRIANQRIQIPPTAQP